MILKLRMCGKDGMSWKLIDKIQGIEYEYMDEPKDMKKRMEEHITYINTYPNLPDKRVAQINMAFENGFYDMLYTDDVVYILNDNGKTCDSINV